MAKKKSPFVGKKIVSVRNMNLEELAAEGWDDLCRCPPIVLMLNDGSIIYASRDEEGNGPGALFATDVSGERTYVG